MDTPTRDAHIGWRLLALVYDLFPVAGLWFLVAAVFVLLHGDAVTGGALGWLEFVALWSVTGAYAILSWRRGGQTLGMRPWRLRVRAPDGGAAPVGAMAAGRSSAKIVSPSCSTAIRRRRFCSWRTLPGQS